MSEYKLMEGWRRDLAIFKDGVRQTPWVKTLSEVSDWASVLGVSVGGGFKDILPPIDGVQPWGVGGYMYNKKQKLK